MRPIVPDPLIRGSEKFEPPMPAKEAQRLPKRDLLTLVKPVLREHDAQPSRGMGGSADEPGWEIRESEYSKQRWNWIYSALGEGAGSGGGLLNRARREIRCEKEHGHYWEPAWSTIRVVQDAWIRYEAEVNYPRPIRRSSEHSTREATRKFVFKARAKRWTARKERAYARYVQRLIREGVYDESEYR